MFLSGEMLFDCSFFFVLPVVPVKERRVTFQKVF